MTTSDNASAPGLDPGLLAEAGATVSAPAMAPGQAPAAPTNWNLEARSLVECVAALGAAFPSVEQVYTPAVIDRLAMAWAPVLERHDLDMGKFTIYFVAGTTTLPVLAATVKAIQHDRAAAKEEAPPAA